VQKRGIGFRNVGEFFEPEGDGPTGPDLLGKYLEVRPVSVQESLRRIVPSDLQEDLGIADWGWLPELQSEEGKGILARAAEEVNEDLTLLRELEERAAAERNYRQSDHYQRVARTVRSRHLLGFLGSRNVLPKYGFPTDVVEMRTNHLSVPVAGRIELQRDLRIAISEYAPGGEVVTAKYIWTSGGLNKRLHHDWPTFHYAVCPECGRFHRSAGRIEGPCTVCGANLFAWPKRYGTFVIPEFGFVVGELPREAGEARPQRMYSSQVYFSEYATPERDEVSAEPPFAEVTDLSSARVRVRQRYSRFGKLAVVNSGQLNRGFRICYTCGFAQPAPEETTGKRRKTRRTPPAHNNPRTGRPCRGTCYSHHLGHEFITDVLELRFQGSLASTPEYELWYSLL